MLQGGINIADNQFRTQKGYDLNREENLTYVMEDYIEMIYRQSLSKGYTRTNTLAKALSLNASSVSKMINKLILLGFVIREKYGIIKLSHKGYLKGEFLYKRHNIIYNFFLKLTGEEIELEKIEQMEHFFDFKILSSMKKYIDDMNKITEIPLSQNKGEFIENEKNKEN